MCCLPEGLTYLPWYSATTVCEVRFYLSRYDADEAKIAAYSWEGLLGAIEALCYQLLIPQMGEETTQRGPRVAITWSSRLEGRMSSAFPFPWTYI